MADLLLDSTIFVDYLYGDPGAKRIVGRIMEGSLECSVCPLTLVDLWLANGMSRKDEIIYQALLGYLQEAPLSMNSARTAGLWLASRSREERLKQQSIAMVAAIAKERQETICTRQPDLYLRFYDNVISYREVLAAEGVLTPLHSVRNQR